MGDQAKAMGCEVHYISAIETGKIAPTIEYIESIRDWLRLDDTQYKALVKRSKSSVIDLRNRSSNGNQSSSMRLFRKISKMDPTQIRCFGKKIHGEAENDGRFSGPTEIS
jgi:transcriptional regulator with XRE-family HTH domain